MKPNMKKNKHMKNILVIAPRYHTNLITFVKSIKKLDHHVNMLVQYKVRTDDYSVLKPTVVKPSLISVVFNWVYFLFKKTQGVDTTTVKTFFPSIRNLSKHFRKIKPKVTFIKGVASPFSIISIIVSKLNKSKPIFMWQINSTQLKKNRAFRFYLHLMQRIFSVGIILTPIDPEISHFNKKMFYMPFSIELEPFSKKYFHNNRVNIIDIGKFLKRKDHLTLLKAFLRLRNRYPNITLTIIGKSTDKNYYKKIQEFIKENQLTNSIKLLSDVPHKQMIKVYRTFDLFVLPSYNEPAAYSILEAMANKLPVISSDENGTKDYIKKGYNGYIFKSRDPKDLAKRIEMIISNKKRIITFGNNSFNLAKKNHSIESTTKLLKKILV